MKLLKFFLKYYLFSKIHNKKNIENVIQSQGIKIYRYDPDDPLSNVSLLMQNCNCWEYAQTRHSFLYINKRERYCFIKSGHAYDDQIILLFHEAAHIWYNHPFRFGLIDDSDIRQEDVANLFLFKLRFLKTFSIMLTLAFLIAGVFFLTSRPSKTVAFSAPIVETEALTDELPAQSSTADPGDTVYITGAGDAYHREFCGTINGSRTKTAVTRSIAESMGRHSCSYCNP